MNLNCLSWFENLIVKNSIESLVKQEYLEFKEENHISHIKKDYRTTFYVLNQNDKGDTIEEAYSEYDLIKHVIEFQSLKTKECINKQWIESKQKRSLLELQFKFIIDISKKGFNQISKYPELKSVLYEIVEHLNTLSEKNTFNLQLPNNKNHTNDEIIIEVLGYLKGYNERQEKIMNDDDFKELILRTSHLVHTGEVPSVDKKLKLDITAELLRCTYWVLHKELFTTKRIRFEFITFLQQNFQLFKDSTEESIKSAFSRRNKIFPHEFIPQIIKKHLP